MASSYTKRVTPEKIGRYLENNPGATEAEARRVLRGHGTTAEHGKVQKMEVAGREINETRSNQAVERIIAKAAREGRRVSVAIADTRDPNGKEVFTNKDRASKGISAKYLMEEQKATGGSWKSFLQGTTFGGNGYDYGAWQPQNITSIRVTVY